MRILNSDEYDEIISLNENNYKDFIEKYGLITDIELAKKCLCITSDAWFVLSEELKNNAEIILYYQPKGYLYEEHFNNYSSVNALANNYGEGYLWAFNEGFEAYFPFTYYYTSLGYSKYDKSKSENSMLQYPVIDYPESFNMDLYYKIQSKLISQESNVCYPIGSIIKQDKLLKILPEAYQHLPYNEEEITQATIYYYLLDRQNLKDIVEEQISIDLQAKQKKLVV